jgi:predicted nucleic acid-binding protein
MKLVFADTIGLLAQWDESDQWHDAAISALNELLSSRSQLVTTTYVLLECGNAAARRPYRYAVIDLCHRLEQYRQLIAPTDDDWQLAWQAYERREAAQAGIVDHVSFQDMRRLNIQEAFTNDCHFAAAGFQTLF